MGGKSSKEKAPKGLTKSPSIKEAAAPKVETPPARELSSAPANLAGGVPGSKTVKVERGDTPTTVIVSVSDNSKASKARLLPNKGTADADQQPGNPAPQQPKSPNAKARNHHHTNGHGHGGASGPASPSGDGLGAVDAEGNRRAPVRIDVVGEQTDGQRLAAALPAVITIPEEASPWVAVFGEPNVRNLHSSDWKEREQSLQAIGRQLSDRKFMTSKEPEVAFPALSQLLAMTLREKVVPVYLAALDLFNASLATYSSRLSAEVLHAGTDPLIATLVHRCCNNNTRIQECSLQALLNTAAQPNFGVAYLGPFALSQVPKKGSDGTSSNAQMVGRMDLVYALLATFNSTRGLAVEDVLSFTRTALDLPDDKVRAAAIKVVAELYRLKSMAGDVLDPQKALGILKPSLLQVLNRRFAEVDELLQNGSIVPSWGGPKAADSPSGSIQKEDQQAAATGVKVFAKPLPPLAGRAHPLSPLHVSGATPLSLLTAGGSCSGSPGHKGLGSGSIGPLGRNGLGNPFSKKAISTDEPCNSDGALGETGDSSSSNREEPGMASPSRAQRFPHSPSLRHNAASARGGSAGQDMPPSPGPSREGGVRTPGSPPRHMSPARNSMTRISSAARKGPFPPTPEGAVDLKEAQECASPARQLPSRGTSSRGTDRARSSVAGSTVLDDTEEGLIEYIMNEKLHT